MPDRGTGRFAAVFGAVLLAVTCLPYLYGLAIRPPETWYSWAVGFLPDTLGNLMFSRQGADGRMLFADLYTAEPHPNRLFAPLFLLLGWAQAATGIFPPLLLQALRLAAGAALVGGLFVLCRRLFPDPRMQKAALVGTLATGGTGFLALFIPFFHRSAEVRGPELSTFFSLYQQAHFAAALALIVLSCVALLRAQEESPLKWSALAGLAYLGLVAVHPYDAPVPAAAVLVWAGLRRAFPSDGATGRPVSLVPLAVFAAFPLPLILYDGWLVNFVPVFREFAREGLVSKPWPAVDYLLGFAFAIPFAVRGIVAVLRDREQAWMFPVAWVLVTPLLLLLPLPASRRLLEGYHLFLALVAFRGVAEFAPFSTRGRRTALAAGLAVASLSSVFVMARDAYALRVAASPSRPEVRMNDGILVFPFHDKVDRLFAGGPWLGGLYLSEADRYFIPRVLVSALKWMESGLPRGTVVACAHETGLFVPIFSGLPVVTGHFGETLNFAMKNLAIRALMDRNLSDHARQLLLDDLGAEALLWDDRLARLGDWRPAGRPWLREAWREGRTTVYLLAKRRPTSDYRSIRAKSEISCAILKADGILRMRMGDYPAAVECFRLARDARPGEPTIRGLLARATGRTAR